MEYLGVTIIGNNFYIPNTIEVRLNHMDNYLRSLGAWADAQIVLVVKQRCANHLQFERRIVQRRIQEFNRVKFKSPVETGDFGRIFTLE